MPRKSLGSQMRLSSNQGVGRRAFKTAALVHGTRGDAVKLGQREEGSDPVLAQEQHHLPQTLTRLYGLDPSNSISLSFLFSSVAGIRPLGSRRKLAVATLQQQQQQEEEEEAERRHSLGASADERWGGMACGNTQKKKIL
ncbi:unnamed protein product [Lampetra planeri]